MTTKSNCIIFHCYRTIARSNRSYRIISHIHIIHLKIFIIAERAITSTTTKNRNRIITKRLTVITKSNRFITNCFCIITHSNCSRTYCFCSIAMCKRIKSACNRISTTRKRAST